MASIADKFDPEIFAKLPDFPEAKKALEKEKDKIRLLGDVICKWDLQEYLGVNLLHKHFELFRDEQMVKSYDKQKNEAYVKPEKIDQTRKSYFYQVASNDGFVFEPLEFFRLEEGKDIPSLEEIVDGKEDFLEEFAKQAESIETTRLFGLALLEHASVKITEYELRLETTDSEQRILIITPADRTTVDPERVTETMWGFLPPSFEPSSEDVFSPSGCIIHCDNHCLSHCDTHCTSHCTSHCMH